MRFDDVIANLEIIEGAAAEHGLVNGAPDADGVVRCVPLVAEGAGQATPRLALELVRVAIGAERIGLDGDGDALRRVRIGEKALAIDPDGRFQPRVAELPDAAVTSALDLLPRRVPPDAFAGRIVLVGEARVASSDIVATPLRAETYGVLVQAQMVDAILSGAALRRPVWAAGAAALVLVGLALLAVSRLGLRRLLGAALLMAVAAIAASWLAFDGAGLLLAPVPVLAPGLAATAAMLAALFVEGTQAQARLRTALEAERVTAARTAGELAATEI